jgi:hypothetical protein
MFIDLKDKVPVYIGSTLTLCGSGNGFIFENEGRQIKCKILIKIKYQ